MAVLRTFPPLPFRVFADAAYNRRRGALIAALQPISQNQSLKATLRVGWPKVRYGISFLVKYRKLIFDQRSIIIE
jgi:hypothetical protein